MGDFTRGPWLVKQPGEHSQRNVRVVGPDIETVGGSVNVGIADILEHRSIFEAGKPSDEEQANAQLISASPDLLEACHAFCRTLAFTPSSVPGAIESDLNAAYEKARAAIKKAEGRL